MKTIAILFSIFTSLSLIGCASAPVKKFSGVKAGMYKGDVLDLVGSPSESRFRGDQYVWTYKFMDDNKWVTKEVHVKNDFVTYAGDPQPMATDSKISRISQGMSKSQVLDVMGFPKKTEKRNGKDAWIYTSKIGGDAQVQFDDDKVSFIGPAAPTEAVSKEPAAKTSEDSKFEPIQ
jgi:outer membrane protein assembly factor BamE (lipoprotein component of BamABCDE complex)